MMKRPKLRVCFDSISIAKRIEMAITRDLVSPHQSYWVDERTRSFFIDSQRRSTLKKFSGSVDSEAQKLASFTDFRNRMSGFDAINTKLRVLEKHPSMDTQLYELLERAKTLVHWVLGDLDIESWYSSCRNSNGVTIGTKYSDTSLEAKFSLPLTCTSLSGLQFHDYLLWDVQLSECLKLQVHGGKSQIVKIVNCSNATTVPKDERKCRFIAIEPTVNMYLQQGLMVEMYRKLKLVGLDVTSLPERHRSLAWSSSITAQKATIDFSNASDCMSIALCAWLLPGDWFTALAQVRSPSIRLSESEVLELPIMSTMGNATTFPLETLIFWSLGVASLMEHHPSRPGFGKRKLATVSEREAVTVFGDDCIIPCYAVDTFIGACSKIGFSINIEKSFYRNEGFRESCGGDFFHGCDVRPFFLRSPTSTYESSLAPWLCNIFNSIRQMYIKYFGPLRWLYNKEALGTIFQLFREHALLVRVVPRYMPEDSGLQDVDLERLMVHYDVPLAKIFSSLESGSLSYTYYRFSYRKNLEVCDDLRYWDWLKKSSARDYVVDATGQPKRVSRRIGGYLVAKSKVSDTTSIRKRKTPKGRLSS